MTDQPFDFPQEEWDNQHLSINDLVDDDDFDYAGDDPELEVIDGFLRTIATDVPDVTVTMKNTNERISN
jgi:hypothetical protein